MRCITSVPHPSERNEVESKNLLFGDFLRKGWDTNKVHGNTDFEQGLKVRC
jgi:hypothetical protein